MNFAHKLTLAVALLLCVTLSAGGAWTIGQNFSAALDAAAADAAVSHMRERYALEDLLGDTSSLPDAADALGGYAGTLQLSGGGEGYRFAVLTGEGMVVWSDMPANLPFADQWQAVGAGTGEMLFCGAGKSRYLLLASPLQTGQAGLYLVGGYDVTREFTEHARQLRQYLMVEGVALVLALTAAALLAWALTRPLRRLESASRDIAAGQYDRRVEVSGGGEFARLAQGFNTMAGAVESHMEALRRQNESRTRFVAAFTHELKTPMTAILGYADLLRSGEQPADVRQLAADYIYHESTRLEHLSRELLTLLGVEEGPPPALRPEGVQGIFGDALRSLPDLGGVTVESHCPPGAKVLGNRALLSDLIRNLILNAAAATAPGGTITLGCERQGSGWRLKVQDTGRGIPPEDLPHVTEAFYMADKSRTRARGGSGLGLSLCAAIAAAHGSKLAIESEPGRGTCVTLDLPDGEEETPCAQ